MASTRIDLLGVHQIDGHWSLVTEGFQKACLDTDLTSHYLWVECRAGRAFLAIVSRDEKVIGAAVFRFEDWPSGCRLRCVILYGRDLAEWVAQLRTFTEELARVGGAVAIVAAGRMGFERVFPEATVTRQSYEMRTCPTTTTSK